MNDNLVTVNDDGTIDLHEHDSRAPVDRLYRVPWPWNGPDAMHGFTVDPARMWTIVHPEPVTFLDHLNQLVPRHTPGFEAYSRHVWVPAQSRGLGSHIRRTGRITMEHLHALVFLAYLCVRHGVADAEDLLCDSGIVHEGVHWKLGAPFVEDTIEHFAARVEKLELALLRFYPEGVRLI